MDNSQTAIHTSQRTLTVSKTTTREVVFKLRQFRETLEKAAKEDRKDLFSLYLGAGYVLMDICEILGLDDVETKAVMGETAAKQRETCYTAIDDNPH